jgi:glycosyltransferase involved in cell wall biosynthesis
MAYTDKLTICIPVYERYDYFEEAIASAINQTVKCRILVTDNGSTHSKFRDYCALHGIDYYTNGINIGAFQNWNKCFQYPNSDYVIIFGDDDILYPTYVEEFLRIEEEYGGLDFYYTNIDLLINGKKEEWDCPAIYGLFNHTIDVLELGAKSRIGIPTAAATWKKSIMLDKPFSEAYYGSNDWLWIYNNVQNLKIYGNENKLLSYRRHDKQDSVTNSFITYYWSYPVIYYTIYENIENKSAFSEQALRKSIDIALDSLMKFEFKVFDYYHAQNNNNLYKIYYRDMLSKKSLPIFLMTLPKPLGYWGLKTYFRIYYFLKRKFIIP